MSDPVKPPGSAQRHKTRPSGKFPFFRALANKQGAILTVYPMTSRTNKGGRGSKNPQMLQTSHKYLPFHQNLLTCRSERLIYCPTLSAEDNILPFQVHSFRLDNEVNCDTNSRWGIAEGLSKIVMPTIKVFSVALPSARYFRLSGFVLPNSD